MASAELGGLETAAAGLRYACAGAVHPALRIQFEMRVETTGGAAAGAAAVARVAAGAASAAGRGLGDQAMQSTIAGTPT